MYNLIAKTIVGPFLDFSRDRQTVKYLRELEKSQWWSREKILQFQNEKLRELARHAYNNVPYYRRVFDERALKPNDIQSSADLTKLPVLTKQLIRRYFDAIKAHGFPANQTILARTGGSTGEPLVFWTTIDDRDKLAFAKVRRALGWWGYELGDKRAVIQLARPHRSLAGRLRRYLERAETFVVWQSARELPLFWDKLERFKPKFISAYPSFVYLLARHVESRGGSKIRPKAIITHSEQLYDFQRELVRKVFNCEIYSHYESFEMNEIAAECPEHTGYHIAAESVIIEIVNNEGEPVPWGREGRILITNLLNYAMPFVRYDSGDVGVISEKTCVCGRGLPLLDKLNGRIMDFVLTRNGKKIPGTSFMVPQVVATFTSEGIDQFQIVQEKREEVVVKVVVAKESSPDRIDKVKDRVVEAYKQILGTDMNIVLEVVDHIPTTRDGKRRVVISKLTDVKDQI
jgi:phenylacetate-CoA ligase